DYQRTEEERRLCYVGMTRAKKKLYLTRAEARRQFGSYSVNMPSRFLSDIPKECLETVQERSREWEVPMSRQQAYQRVVHDDFDFDQRFHDDDEGAAGDFARGDRVVHPSFGEGIVQKIEKIGEDDCLSISFARRGLKKVLARYVSK